jgi:hypothetical protein
MKRLLADALCSADLSLLSGGRAKGKRTPLGGVPSDVGVSEIVFVFEPVIRTRLTCYRTYAESRPRATSYTAVLIRIAPEVRGSR